jgi:hypothetical protein
MKSKKDYEKEVQSEIIDAFVNSYELDKERYLYTSNEMDSLNSGSLDLDEYQFSRSINGMKNYFIDVKIDNEENTDCKPISSRNEISAILKSVLGIKDSLLGELSERNLKTLKVEGEHHLELHDWTFESGTILQYYLMRPLGNISYQRPMLALYGCSSSPDNILGLTEPYYSNNFGLEAVRKGWSVVAPYHLNICDLIERLDSLGP